MDLSEWKIEPEHFLKSFISQAWVKKLDSVITIRLNKYTYLGLHQFIQQDHGVQTWTQKLTGGKRDKKLGECSELKLFSDRFMILDKKQILSVWINFKP